MSAYLITYMGTTFFTKGLYDIYDCIKYNAITAEEADITTMDIPARLDIVQSIIDSITKNEPVEDNDDFIILTTGQDIQDPRTKSMTYLQEIVDQINCIYNQTRYLQAHSHWYWNYKTLIQSNIKQIIRLLSIMDTRINMIQTVQKCCKND